MLRKKEILKLFNGTFLKIDLNNSIIKIVQKGNKIIARNKTYDYLKCIIDFEDVILTETVSLEDLIFFIEHKEINGSFLFPFKNKNNEENYYRLIKSVKGDEAIIYCEKVDKNQESYSLTDPLTNVYQKSSIKDFIVNEINSNKPRNFLMIIMDIDNFKQFNDKYGHMLGDQVLELVAKKIKLYFPNGYIGRIGGDEFLIMDFNYNEIEALKTYFNKFLVSISQLSFKNVDAKVTVSIGVSRLPIDGNTYDELFKKADEALYASKKKGKNLFSFYNLD